MATVLRQPLSAIVICCLSGVLGAAQSRPAGKLDGTVLDTSNTVLPGVTIALKGAAERNATSDTAGKFVFADLPPGDYEIRVALPGFSTVVRNATVTESTAPLLIRMRVGSSAGQITGSVRDTAGVLLAGIFVEVSSPDLDEKYRSTITRSDGRYRFVDLPDGAYSVTFSARGFWKQQRNNVELTNGSTASVDTTMQVGGNECEELSPEACKR